MTEARRPTDPVRPEAPPAPGWVPDPWGDGERYWDGEIWTRRTRPFGAAPSPAEADLDAEPDPSTDAPAVAAPPAGPRDWDAVSDEEEDEDRPLRSGLQRGMIWAFAVAAILGLVLTAFSMLLGRGFAPTAPSPEVPQRSAHSLLYSTGSFTGSV